jgi:hypothetical protein
MTAVEWLEDNLLSEPLAEEHFKHNSECWDKAKEMERLANNPQTFEQAVKPLMKWLCENTHPHTTAIVTGNLSELVEGIEIVKTDEFIVD